MSFTLVFDGEIRHLAFNPFKAETPFGRPTASGAGDAFAKIDRMEAIINRFLLVCDVGGHDSYDIYRACEFARKELTTGKCDG